MNVENVKDGGIVLWALLGSSSIFFLIVVMSKVEAKHTEGKQRRGAHPLGEEGKRLWMGVDGRRAFEREEHLHWLGAKMAGKCGWENVRRPLIC